LSLGFTVLEGPVRSLTIVDHGDATATLRRSGTVPFEHPPKVRAYVNNAGHNKLWGTTRGKKKTARQDHLGTEVVRRGEKKKEKFRKPSSLIEKKIRRK